MVIQVDRKMSMAKVQEIVNNIEKEVEKNIPGSDISVRTHSIHLDNETIIDSVHALAGSHNVSIHEVLVDELGECKCISYHVEILDSLNAKEAHVIASELERSIREELGEKVIINSHIEPMKNSTVLSQELTKQEEERIVLDIRRASSAVSNLNNLHDFVIRKTGNGYFISFHCVFLEDMTLEDVHDAVSELEDLIKDKISGARRVIIHAEPD
jgi:divalent metal cation (Fe/Co/Zn/Cd) transporter